MKQIIHQLERVRQTARLLLMARAASRSVALLLTVALLCAFVDFALRLPDWMRIAIDLVLLVLAARWLWRQGLVVWQFWPSLSQLALRAERLFPQLSGVLASGVELSDAAQRNDWPARTGALAAVSIDHARRQAQGIAWRRMVDPRRPIGALATVCAVIVMFFALVWAAPVQAGIAAQRWLTPWRTAPWPKRTRIQVLPHPEFHLADQPLLLRTRIDPEYGYYRDMRVWVYWRSVDVDGQLGTEQRALMNESTSYKAMFERLVDLPEADAVRSDATDGVGTVQFRFEAGDDQTEPQSIMLVQRPALTGLSLSIAPPRYARGLIDARSVDLAMQSGQMVTTSILEGSTVSLQMQLNKPIPRASATLAKLLPGLAQDVAEASIDLNNLAASTARIGVTFRLDKTVQSPVKLIDTLKDRSNKTHEFVSLSQRQYRLEMTADRPPSATIVEPASDESVLATAVLDLRAAAQDDVGVEELSIESQAPDRSQPENATQKCATTLHTVAGRNVELAAQYTLDLAPWRLQPGDAVFLAAVAQDVFALDGRRHEAVRSARRKLSIIDPGTMIGQLRSELAGVRQQAIRLESRQRQLLETPAADSKVPQGQITRHLDANAAAVQALERRIERNRLDEPALSNLVKTAGELLDEARKASQQARQNLEQALRQPRQAPQQLKEARQQQKQVSSKLVDLIAQLDQGRDALTLQLQLGQLRQKQRDLADDLRKTAPQTRGLKPAELTESQRRRLAELARRQEALRARSRELINQMRATAEALSQPKSSEQDQAAAEALSKAASIAQRQGLDQTMQKAAKATKQNQLGSAGANQGRSQDIMRAMLRQMGKQDQRGREILRRRLIELAQAIEKLVARQKTQMQLLEQATEIPALDGPLSMLRRNTLSVRDQAQRGRTTKPAGDELAQAAAAQATAITAMRGAQRRQAAAGEAEALRRLEAALSIVRALRRKTEQEQVRRSREQLRQAYEELALRQDELRGKTEPLALGAALNRRRRAQVVALGDQQATLRDDAAAVIEDVEPPLLFRYVHRRIDDVADDAAEFLRQSQELAEVLEMQTSVAAMLRQLATALEQAQKKEPFDRPPQESAGGQGGGGAKPKLIPPATQLRLLRAMQVGLNDRTRQMHETGDPDAARHDSKLRRLGDEQRQLGALGEQLIERLTRPMPVNQRP